MSHHNYPSIVSVPHHTMPPVLKNRFYSREVAPGIITVTPVPIEAPIHSRPVVQSRPPNVNTSLPIAASKPPKPHAVNWPVLILFLFLGLLLALVLSKWGWSKLTGKIWKWSSGWDGPLEDEDLEELIQESRSEASTHKDVNTDVVREIESSEWNLYDRDLTSTEEWVLRNPRSM